MKRIFLVCLSILAVLISSNVSGAGLTTGLRIGPESGAPDSRLPVQPRENAEHVRALRAASTSLPGEKLNTLINLRSDDAAGETSGRAPWTESVIDGTTTSGQGLVDTCIGADGYIYAAYWDDYVPAASGPAYFVKRSTDGGATWTNPDAGSNGFALTDMFMDRPSIEVFYTGSAYRIAVAFSAPWPYETSLNDIIICYKNIGTASFTAVSVQADTSENYLMPRIKAVKRPSNPSLKRIVCASYGYSDGKLYCDYSDANAASWGSYSYINPATDQVLVWRADFMEDVDNSRLYCTWAADVSGTTGDHPRVILALSTNQGASWFSTLYAISPTGWDYCAEPDGAVAGNASQADKTFMAAWSGAQTAGGLFNVYYSYQFLNSVTVSAPNWNPGTITYGTIYSDTDYDNTMPAIVEDNRLPAGGYRVALLDQHLMAMAQIRYTECTFDTPVSWLAPEVASGEAANPARQGSTALSMGVGFTTNLSYPNRRCVMWPDFRNPTCDMYAAWSDMNEETPTVTPTAEPTGTPTATPTTELTMPPTSTPTEIPSETPTGVPSDTPTPTPTALPVPATAPGGLLMLIVAVSVLLGLRMKK